MKNHPSPRHSVVRTSEAEVAYVADNKGDAQALARQMGGLVEIRYRIIEEVPFRRRETFLIPQTSETFSTSKRSSKKHPRFAKPYRL
jgi:hypothetical protein